MRRFLALNRTLLVVVLVFVAGTTAAQEPEVKLPDETPKKEAPPADPNPQPAAEEAEPEYILRVYQVGELLAPRPKYPFRGDVIPTTEPQGEENRPGWPMGIGGGGLGGGTSGDQGTTQGGGFFRVGGGAPKHVLGQFGGLGEGGAYTFMANPNTGPSFSIDQLIDAITSTVDPDSWQEVGGAGACTALGHMLLVRQTEGAHQQIEKLLKEISANSGGAKTVTVEARWLLLNYDAIRKWNDFGKDAEGEQFFTELVETAEAPGYLGTITCLNGQTVHMVSGARRTVLTGAIPVIGSDVGYQQQTAIPNVGVLLQVTPTISLDGKQALLDVQSSVTNWRDPDPLGAPDRGVFKKEDGGSSLVTLDRLNLAAHQLATSIRLTLDKFALVGGMTLTDGEADDEDRELYLFLRVNAN